MPFVLDASIAASWHFGDERSPQTDAVLHVLARDIALVPPHWWFEIRNALLLGERRGRASEEDTTRFLDRLSILPIELARLPDEAIAMNLARRHRLSFYDAAYVELAQRERLALATNDHKLGAAARAEGVPLFGVSL